MTNYSRHAALTAAALLAAYAVPSTAAPLGDPQAAFAAVPVGDADLAAVRGGMLPARYVRSMADEQARDSFRQTGALGTLTFDNWFNDVGSVLIVNALLAAQR